MKLQYKSQAVEKYFSDFELMKKKIGKDPARGTKKRCDHLRAASNFSVYLTTGLGKPHLLVGNLKGCYAVSISSNVRLIIKPDTDSLDPKSMANCDSVTIKGVVDYHGQKHEWLVP